MSRVGDVAAGRPLGAETAVALEAYERSSGDPASTVATMTSGELSNLLIMSDLVTLLVEGLRLPAPTRLAPRSSPGSSSFARYRWPAAPT